MRKSWFNFSAFFSHPLIRGTLAFCAVIATVAALAAVYYPIHRYARQIATQRSASCSVSIELAHQPAWVSSQLSGLILEQARAFAQETSPDAATGKPIKNFARLQDPTDGSILADLANTFMAHQAERNNAWIKNISAIHRVYDRPHDQQKITIDAEYRNPVALVVQGDSYYQVDADGTRLPGVLALQDCVALQSRRTIPLMVIRGADSSLPDPGQRFTTADFAAAMQLVDIFSSQPYVRQIAAINVANYGGRMDKMAPQITLDTAFGTQIWWGRPAHDETIYEVSLPAKLKMLKHIAMRYSRIDAAHRYVDIRFEQPRVPAPEPAITQENLTPPIAPRHG